jgi:NADH-ubiquinone oxidoreductase chain 5
MYLLIVFLPLLGSISAGFFGTLLGEEGSVRLTTSLLGISSALSLLAFYEVGLKNASLSIKLSNWFESEFLIVDWGFQFDSLTVIMLVVVCFVSSLVHLYSIEYMRGDPHRPRFFAYLSLFTFFMLILVTADNYVQMFVGWEGVGLCSYLLINFWFTRLQANKSAIQAMLVNRIGDFGLALGIMAIFAEFQAVDYSTVFANAPEALGHHLNFLNFQINSLNLIAILLFIGAVGKSAQLGLHTWLPNAMEGPTPVSALIHAATMVTAGVFLLARSSPLIEYAPSALTVIAIVGAMTAFFAATTGLLQNDLKKVIAYSTCSQLGYMIFACGLSAYEAGVFHLSNHAFFKALLFLSAGSVIHAMADEQDIRRLGGLHQILPFSYAMMLIGSLALIGFPFLTGFYSKDLILELAFANYSIAGHFSYWLGTVAAFFTAFYSTRLLYLSFLSKPAGFRKSYEGAHDSPIQMALPLFLLSLGSLFIGYTTKDLFVGVGTNYWANALFIHPSHLSLWEAEFLPSSIKLLPVLLSLFGAFSGFILYSVYGSSLYALKVKTSFGRQLYSFLNRKWFFDKVYNEFVILPSLQISYHNTYKLVDRGMIEILGPYGLSHFLYSKAKALSQFHIGYVYNYTLVFSLAILLSILFVLDNQHFFGFSVEGLIFFFILALLLI